MCSATAARITAQPGVLAGTTLALRDVTSPAVLLLTCALITGPELKQLKLPHDTYLYYCLFAVILTSGFTELAGPM